MNRRLHICLSISFQNAILDMSFDEIVVSINDNIEI